MFGPASSIRRQLDLALGEGLPAYGCRGVCPRSATYDVAATPLRTATGLPTQQQQTKTTVPQQAYSIYYSCVPGRGGHPAWRVHAPTPSDGPYGREGNVEEEDSLLSNGMDNPEKWKNRFVNRISDSKIGFPIKISICQFFWIVHSI